MLLGAATLGFYVFFVVPRWIEVTHHSIAGQVSQPLRIAHLGDLQARGFGLHESEIARLVGRAHPDLIVVTGDVVDGNSLEPARELLRRLYAPLGVWVMGDGKSRVWLDDQRAFYRSVGARFLENDGHLVREDVFIVGLADVAEARGDPGTPFGSAPAAAFKLALFHAPGRFADLAGLFDLGLASDTRGGGQPGMPGSRAGERRYTQGWYTTNRSNLYVSRGLATTPVPARLLSRPEIALIEIRPS
jgi:predicted MPP superfamily phosphohydrolase